MELTDNIDLQIHKCKTVGLTVYGIILGKKQFIELAKYAHETYGYIMRSGKDGHEYKGYTVRESLDEDELGIICHS